MDQQGQAIGPGGRRLHIGHRRSPSEMTPFMAQQLQLTMNAGQLPTVEQLAIQHQIELLQAQQQQILAQQQYLSQTQQQQGFVFPMAQQLAPQAQSFQFPQAQQAQNVQMGMPTQPQSHRRSQSNMSGFVQQQQQQQAAGGPPPAPSSGAANFGEFQAPNQNQAPQRRGSASGGASGHQRRHSLALPEARKAAELAQQARKGTTPDAGPPPAGFQFPVPGEKLGVDNLRASEPLSPGSVPFDGTKEPSPTAAPATLASSSSNVSGLGSRSRLSGHGRSQSMAVNGKNPVGGRMGGFQFPASSENAAPNAPATGGSASGTGTVERRASSNYPGSHGRSASRNFDGNWRQNSVSSTQLPSTSETGQSNAVQTLQNAFAAPSFTPGHRTRASVGGSVSSMGSFSFPSQQPILMQGQGMMFNPVGQPALLNANLLQQQQQQLNQLQLQQAAQALNQQQMNIGQMGGQNMTAQQQQQQQQQQQAQQQRKTLFTPYLPQASLPALLSNGQLVSGILRVNKKNRSDAYVSTQDGLLDADIFICGSKDRNRALEGDLVAVELLDVDDVWGQKREKEEKKKRKDISDTRTGGDKPEKADVSENTTSEGGIKRRGSLRQRPTQKKNDDVEVEGQGLLLNEEEEVSDEQKPLYAGHIVAVIERVAGQMFSGTLGLLRPSSQATKEKQEAERQASGRPSQPERGQDKPKIVWFKPTDKRVPLIAIPTEQAPRDFVENHQTYANRIFVACIKRWPITSLHPFGTLVEMLGEMGDLKIETDALLRDNNFGPDEFSDAVLKSIALEDWSVESEADSIATRKDFRSERTFTIDPNGSQDLEDAVHVKKISDGVVEVGVHITDVAHFVKANSLVDREAKKRGTGVSLINRNVPMLPPKLSEDICALSPGQERFTVSVVFKVDTETGKVYEDDVWVGKTIIKSSGKMSYKDVDRLISEGDHSGLDETLVDDVKLLHSLTTKFRQTRFDAAGMNIPSLRLFFQLDDENVPVEDNLFNTAPSHEVIEELIIKANTYVAKRIVKAFPDKAVLRRQATPLQRRLDSFADRMRPLGYDIDTSSSAALQKSVFKVKDDDIRKGMETLLAKTMHRAKYFIASKVPEDYYIHYSMNLPIFTHFNSPIRRYADVIVHRQLEAALISDTPEFPDDVDTLSKTIEQCNVKKDSAKNAQEQSVHLELCRVVDRRRQEAGGELICEAVVINVYESAFDVLIPEYGFEKRVHCDQLPLKKAEFDKKSRILELYWEKGVQSSSYIPEDERPKGAALRAHNAAAAAEKKAAAEEEAQRKAMQTSSLPSDEVDALFDDEDSEVNDATEQMGGVTLSPPVSNRPTQSMPPSPTKGSPSGQTPHRTRSDPKLSVSSKDTPIKSNKELYSHMFTLREENGNYIQEVTEMTRIPVILRAELSKSPPCLTTRTLNPYAL